MSRASLQLLLLPLCFILNFEIGRAQNSCITCPDNLIPNGTFELVNNDIANDYPNCNSCIYFIGGFYTPCDYHTLSCWQYGSWNLWTSGEECGTNPPPMDATGQVSSWNNDLSNNMVRLNSCPFGPNQVWHEASMKADLINAAESDETYTISFYAYGNSINNSNFTSIPLTFAFANSENLSSLDQLDYAPENGLENIVFEIPDNNQWNYYTSTFTYTNATNASKIWLGITPNELLFTGEGAIADLLIDNLTMVHQTACSLTLSSVVTPTSCPLRSDGAIDLSVSGNVCDVTYVWSGPVSSNLEDLTLLPAGTYTVTVSDQMCSITETIVVGSLQMTTIPPITSQAMADQYLNNQTVYVNGDVIINPPATTWMIHDCLLLFNSGENLIINEGAAAAFSYVELDACGPSWGGIDIKSSNITSLPAGGIKGGDHLIIRHANTGIYTRDAGNAQTNFANYRCGWMTITNSEFIDNKRAVYIRRGNNLFYQNNTILSEISFENCRFEWTPDITNHFSSFYSSPATLRLMEIEDYKGILIKDCRFNNSTLEGNWNKRGAGIYFYRSKVNLVNSQPNTDLFEVNGFSVGIRSNTATTQNTGSTIHGIKLKKNKVGINTILTDDISILESNIAVGFPTSVAALDAAAVKYEGIAINGGTNFFVSENNIVGGIAGGTYTSDFDTPYTAGITAIATSTDDDEIYNNRLQSLNWALIANGNNRTGSFGGGLRYVCNKNLANDHDFAVANAANSGIASIATVQSDLPDDDNLLEVAAGNTFTQANTWPANDFSVQAASSAITYRYYNGNANEIPTSVNANVTATALNGLGIPNNQNFCTSEIFELVNPDLSINLSNLTYFELQRDNARTDWLATKYVWATLIDGGSTETLCEEIGGGYSTDTWVERNKLLNYSPYLSEQVLYDVVDNTTLFPHPIAMEIILANPQIVQNKLFLDHLSLKSDPMPEYMIDILTELENTENSRTILEGELRFLHSTYLNNARKVMMAKVQDSTFTTEDKINEFRQWRSIPAYLSVMDYLMENQDFPSIEQEWLNLNAHCTPSKEAEQDLDTYATWIDLRMRLSNDEVDLSSMPQSYIEEMIALAENNPYSSGGIRAAALLHQLYDAEYYLEPFAPMEPLTNKSLKIKKSATATHYLSVYPDPAVDLVNLRLSIPEFIFENTTISIYDLAGKLYSQINVQHHDQMFTINTTDWPAGSYQVVVNNNDAALTHHALIILK